MSRDDLEQVLTIYNGAKNRILLYIEAAVPPKQFHALRRLVLDELGRDGTEGKVRELTERNGPAGLPSGQAGSEFSKGGGGYG